MRFFALFSETLFHSLPSHTNNFISRSAAIFSIIWAPRFIKFLLETISLPPRFLNIGCNKLGSRSFTFLQRNDRSMIIKNLAIKFFPTPIHIIWIIKNVSSREWDLRSSRNASWLNRFIDRFITISDLGRGSFEFRTA